MINVTKVKDLEFSDLYLGHPSLEDRFSDVPGAEANPLPAGPPLRADLDRLIKVCRDTLDAAPLVAEFKVWYEAVTYRVSVMRTLGGTVFVLRKIAGVIHSLPELGIPQAYIRHLMAKDLSGLLVISGQPKSGKTMTACGLVKDRLAAYGGVAVTGEDPIELPLEGSYGQGICFQTATSRDKGGFADAFRHLARWGARIILIDEIRDQDMAAEVLQASVNGNLIITTMLADNIVQSVSKLHALANDRLASGGMQSLLADGLVGVLHQQIVRGPKYKLETDFLYLKDAPVAKNLLRNARFEMLESEVKQQKAQMISGNAAARRFAEG
ncbi:secretion system protein E [Noviherbaspirillum cavernae]|uniref:Secretion system protein E n=1 Tax=Noviherbaspirillum cavernae TaxID=2320862 RepID=A0A418WVX8_9BURK|nr:ATPase, T2SS/T4P/T4SS family [Noviherbaspirillum cavernae]RJF96856.1 secretion system protein E [Noviherbaspirillum cavernae]